MSSSADTTLYLVRPESLDQAWPLAEPWIAKALRRSDCVSTDACRGFIAEGKWHLFMAIGEGCEAVCVAEIQQYPLRKVLSIYVCTGKDHTRWVKHLDQIEAWAREQGCSRVVAFARKGWAKLLPKYHSTHIILELDL